MTFTLEAVEKPKSKQPEYRVVIPSGIPQELKEMKIWAAWKSIVDPEKEKPGKLPMSYQKNPVTGLEEVKPASCNNPDTWMTFEDAERLKKSSRAFKGFQVALCPTVPRDDEDRLIGIDIDNALQEEGTIKPEYLEWVTKFNTYFELSPGNGIRGFCFGHFPTYEGKHEGNIEIYQNGKWMSVTGQKLASSPITINTSQETVEAFRAQYFKALNEIDGSDLPISNKIFTDEEIINRLKSSKNTKISENFRDFYYAGKLLLSEDGVPDHSLTDFSLCALLVFWTQEIEQIDRIFKTSALYREEKWNKIHFGNGDTYGLGTIKAALNCRKNVYTERIAKPLPEKINFENLHISLPRYEVTEKGIAYITMTRDGDPIETTITTTPCIIIAKGLNADEGNKTYYKLLIKTGAHRENIVWKNTSGIMTKSGVLELMSHDFRFQEADYSKITGYFAAFLEEYEQTLPVEMIASKSGWKEKNTKFVMGNRLITKEGVTDIKQIDNPTAELYHAEGNIERWTEGAEYFLKFPQIRFKAYVAVTPIVLKLIDGANFVFDQNCGSTRLKSFSNQLCASMFGHPKHLQLDTDSTKVGLTGIAAACNELPMFLDETSQNQEFICSLIYRFANANTRVKGNQAHGLELSENFVTVVVATGEDPLITENAKGGQDARRVPEKHGIPEKGGKPVVVPTEIVNRTKRAMYGNYGHVGVLFVQTLLEEIDTIQDTSDSFFKVFPSVENVMHERMKGYYVAILTAGYILEKVFAKLGISAMDPQKICGEYFEENVLRGNVEPDYIKILRIAYDLYVSNEAHFLADDETDSETNEEKREMIERFGWITSRKKKGAEEETFINFRPQSLKDHIARTLNTKDAANRYETATNQWRDLKILSLTERKNPETGKVETLKTCQIQVKGKRVSALQISLDKFYEHLRLEENSNVKNPENCEEDNNPDIPEESEISVPKLNLNVSGGTIVHKSGSFSVLETMTQGLQGVTEEGQ